MVYGLVLIVHVTACLLLIAIVLVQGGRGGLADSLSGGMTQSLFGGTANTVMTKVTAIGSGIFMVTCLTLAMLSTARGRSVMEQIPTSLPGVHLPGPESAVPSAIPTPSTSQTPSALESAQDSTTSAVGDPAIAPRPSDVGDTAVQ